MFKFVIRNSYTLHNTDLNCPVLYTIMKPPQVCYVLILLNNKAKQCFRSSVQYLVLNGTVFQTLNNTTFVQLLTKVAYYNKSTFNYKNINK